MSEDKRTGRHLLVKPSPLDLISTQSPLSLKTGPLKPLQPEEVQCGLSPLTHTRLQGASVLPYFPLHKHHSGPTEEASPN